jgi:YVTN family beta-propeller protein
MISMRRVVLIPLTLVLSIGGAGMLHPAAASRTLVVVNKLGDTLAFFDPATNTRLTTIPLPTHPHEIAVASDGRTAYVSIYGDGVYGRNEHPGHTIEIIDLQKREKLGEIDLGTFRAPHAMAFDPAGRLWVACDASSAVVVIDRNARKVVGSISTATTGSHWLVMLPDGKKAYTSNKDTTHMSVLDVAAMKMTGTIPMPNGSDGLTTTRDGHRLYVADLKEPLLHVIDTTTDREIQSVALKGRPMRVRLTLDERYALTSDSGAGVVEIVDIETFTWKGQIPVGKSPMGFAFPGPAHRAFVTNHNDGTISLIDPDALSVITTFPTDAGPETMLIVDSR